jgi:small subunit ribosomal protein S11
MSEEKQKTEAAAPSSKGGDDEAKAAVSENRKTAKEAEAAKGKSAEEEAKSSQPSAQDLLKADVSEVKVRRAKGSKNIHSGTVHILATFNNTKVTFSDRQGNVISWSSAGKCNFRGSRKSTAFAAQIVTQDAGRAAMSHGLREVEVRVRGPGMGRDSAIRALQSLGFTVTSITDVTPIPHNGCRPPKRRRV